MFEIEAAGDQTQEKQEHQEVRLIEPYFEDVDQEEAEKWWESIINEDLKEGQEAANSYHRLPPEDLLLITIKLLPGTIVLHEGKYRKIKYTVKIELTGVDLELGYTQGRIPGTKDPILFRSALLPLPSDDISIREATSERVEDIQSEEYSN